MQSIHLPFIKFDSNGIEKKSHSCSWNSKYLSLVTIVNYLHPNKKIDLTYRCLGRMLKDVTSRVHVDGRVPALHDSQLYFSVIISIHVTSWWTFCWDRKEGPCILVQFKEPWESFIVVPCLCRLLSPGRKFSVVINTEMLIINNSIIDAFQLEPLRLLVEIHRLEKSLKQWLQDRFILHLIFGKYVGLTIPFRLVFNN